MRGFCPLRFEVPQYHSRTDMLKGLTNELTSRLARRGLLKRLQQYSDDISTLRNERLPAKELIERLASFWSRVKLADLLPLTPTMLMNTNISCTQQNLPKLVEMFFNVNIYIAEERDGLIERYAKRASKEVSVVVLDHYLADDKQRDIDVGLTLRHLQSALLCHQSYLEAQETEFYQRQCEYLYLEVLTLTEVLVDLALKREGIETT